MGYKIEIFRETSVVPYDGLLDRVDVDDDATGAIREAVEGLETGALMFVAAGETDYFSADSAADLLPPTAVEGDYLAISDDGSTYGKRWLRFSVEREIRFIAVERETAEIEA